MISYTSYNICSTWFLDIVISTCFLFVIRQHCCTSKLACVIVHEGTDAAKDPLGLGEQSLAGFKYFNNAI